LQSLEVARSSDQIIRAALESSIIDFEDAVSGEAANAIVLEFIVLGNIVDFRNSSFPAILPEELVAIIKI